MPIAVIIPEYNLTGNMTNSVLKDITFYHLDNKPVKLIYFLPYSRGKGHRVQNYFNVTFEEIRVDNRIDG